MARIGINAQLLTFAQTYRNAGTSAFIYHLLRNLPSIATEHEFVVFTNAGSADLPLGSDPRFQLVASRLNTERPARRIVWEQTVLPWLLSRKRVDVVHGTLNVLPLARRIPGVVTIHDVSFLLFPERFLPGRRRYLTHFTRLSVRGARRVVASSENTRHDIIRLMHVPEERVRVAHLGVEDRFRCRPDAEVLARFRETRHLPEEFFLYIGTLEPRKNLVRLVDAYGAARKRGIDWPLILAGGKGWLYDEIFQRVQDLGLADHVQFPGYVLDDEKPLWYTAASAFVYPSLYEGFGLPVAEAMACGCPVLTARNSSLVEVAGDAAILVDGQDEAGLADGLCRLAESSSTRNELSVRGLAQSAQFDWARTTANVVAAYDEALKEA